MPLRIRKDSMERFDVKVSLTHQSTSGWDRRNSLNFTILWRNQWDLERFFLTECFGKSLVTTQLAAWICLRWFFTFYHSKSPLNHHLGNISYFFPSILCKSMELAQSKLLANTYLVEKLKFKLLFQGPKGQVSKAPLNHSGSSTHPQPESKFSPVWTCWTRQYKGLSSFRMIWADEPPHCFGLQNKNQGTAY